MPSKISGWFPVTTGAKPKETREAEQGRTTRARREMNLPKALENHASAPTQAYCPKKQLKNSGKSRIPKGFARNIETPGKNPRVTRLQWLKKDRTEIAHGEFWLFEFA